MITVCDGDEQCLYDTKAMGSLEIGEMTKNAHRYYRFLDQAMKPGKQFGHLRSLLRDWSFIPVIAFLIGREIYLSLSGITNDTGLSRKCKLNNIQLMSVLPKLYFWS